MSHSDLGVESLGLNDGTMEPRETCFHNAAWSCHGGSMLVVELPELHYGESMEWPHFLSARWLHSQCRTVGGLTEVRTEIPGRRASPGCPVLGTR